MSFVYFVRAEYARKAVKIGRANNVAKRLAGLQTACPEELTLLCAVRCSEWRPIAASALEAKLHASFADLRIHGEWFEWHDDIARAIEYLADPPCNDRGEIDVARLVFARSGGIR